MVAEWLTIAAAAAAAQSPADPPKKSDEIIVTGERVKRSLKDTPSSVVVITQRDIEGQPVDRVEQLLAQVPNVQLGNGSQGPTIRGQDTTGVLQALPAFLGGNRPRTTLIVDGRRTGYNEFVFGAQPVWDVNRIEVFRSPQTTTQGQNSIAGAILVYTDEPTFEPEYRARGIVGDLHSRQVSALLSGPLLRDQLAFRVAGDLSYARTSSRIVDIVKGGDPNHDVFGLLRAKLLATPRSLPGSRFELIYSHVQSQAPQVVGVSAPFRQRHDRFPGYGTFRTNVDSLVATADIRATSDLGINVLATGGDGHFQRLAFPGFGQARIRRRDWSLETVANWNPQGPLGVVGGVSTTHSALRQFIDLSLLTGIGRFRDWQDDAGIFGEARLAVLPRTTLTAGIRYQRDRQKREGALAAIPLDYDRTFHAWLPKVSLAYDFTPTFRAGVLVERAYNPGGTTLRFDTGQPDNFEAESLWDYEIFARARLAGGAVRAEANLFYYDMRNAQRAKDIEIPIGLGRSVGFADQFNVPEARSYGLEASARWRASANFSLDVGLGLLGTRIVQAEGAYAEFQGKEFERSPHLSASISADWRPVPRLRLTAQARHNGRYFSDDLNDPQLRIEGSTKVDARAEFDTGKARVFGYARNLFDKFYMVSLFAPTAGEAADPREIGIGIESRF